jgi:hypothetical protein
MKLFRVHAYAVEPERTADGSSPPFGGSISVNKDIEKALQDAASQFRLQHPIAVDLRVDTTTRTSEVREAMLTFSFSSASKDNSAARDLATRLSRAMDRRSSPCLFVAAASKDGDRRRLTIWTFPREEAFQFKGGATTPSIHLLTDIFSRTSRLRKAALFEGGNRRTDFLSGSVLDFQASSTSRDVADFWIVRFLGALLAVHGPTGTRHLARCLRTAYEKSKTPAEEEQLYAAVMAVRRSPKTRWSLREFADRYLEGHAWETFIATAPNRETVDSSFDFDLTVFDGALNFRIFGLDTGVFVSTPLREVGKSVVLSGTAKKVLHCKGTVVEEHLRTRHA